MMKKLFPLTSLSVLAALASVQTSHAQATGFADVAVVSATMGVNDGRLCTGEFSRGDIGCAANAPLVSRTTGYLGVGTANPSTTLTVSGTTYTGFLQLDAKTGAAAPSSFQGGHWTASGTAVYYNGGSVGIGTNSPSTKLDLGNNAGDPSSSPNKISLFYHGPLDYYGFGISSGDLDYFATSNHRFYISDGSSWLERLTVLRNGNVGIGITNPTSKLELNGNAQFYTSPSNNNAVLSIHNTTLTGQGDNNTHFGYNFGGVVTNFIRGTDTRVDGNLIVGGVAYKSGGGDWAASSDARLKNIDGAYTVGLEEIVSLKPVRFHYRKNNPRNEPSDRAFVGLIAQEVKEVIPEAVTMRADGYYDLDATPISYAVINAIKELKAENDALRAAHAADIKDLRTEVEALKRAIPAATRH